MPLLLTRYFAQLKQVKHLSCKYRGGDLSVRLLAVSKTKPVSDIYALYRVGQRDFGENYLQEALEKQKKLAHLAINWHFIGPVQSNKTRDIARRFQWVHSVDRLKIAKRLNQQRPDTLPPLNICLQVNIDGEPTKSGFSLDDLAEAVEALMGLEKIRIRGLMAIPKATRDVELQREPFNRLRQAKNQLNAQFGLDMDTLSMGMSGDLEAAIAEGSTMVRIGTAIFGSRN